MSINDNPSTSSSENQPVITIQQIAQEKNPLRRAALLHCRFFYTSGIALQTMLDYRDRLIDQHDSEWPHDAFWREVDAIVPPEVK